MRGIFMSSVGDGLCFGVRVEPSHLGKSYFQCDWGGDSIINAIDGNERLYYSLTGKGAGPQAFLLSHYHADHYRGLVAAARDHKYNTVSWAPEKVYVPGMPEFSEKSEFYMALFCMSAYILGTTHTSMEHDLVQAIMIVGAGRGYQHRRGFDMVRLYQGDRFQVGGEGFEVAWPPRKITQQNVIKPIREAVEAYVEAKENDKSFADFARRMETRVKEERSYRAERDHYDYNERRWFRGGEFEQSETRNLTAFVAEANKKLRDAANALSVVFFQAGNILSMGDACPSVYTPIVNYLIGRGAIDYNAIVAPHHGSLWGKELFSLRADNVLVSNGRKLYPKYKSEWGLIGKYVHATHINHDVVV